MSHEHPAPDALHRFLLGTASREENRRVVRHLLARCATCAASNRSFFEPEAGGEPADELIARAVRRVAGLA